ncbi:TPA: hypothetical protein PTV97_003730 [Clostridium botulinum]|nr:hypothetical protein [Clostridium botulinum]
MIFLTMEGNDVRYNFMPLDVKHGEKDFDGSLFSQEELKSRGVLIHDDKIPTPNPPLGMKAKLNLDIPNQKVYYTYELSDTIKAKKDLQEQLTILSQDLAVSKVKDMKNSASIQSLTKEIARLKIQLMNNKGVK